MAGKIPAKRLDIAQFEHKLVTHCAPVLAGLKSANLFRFSVLEMEAFPDIVHWYHVQLSEKGVSIRLLYFSGKQALIYVFREKKLLEELRYPGVTEFLLKEGYPAEILSAQLDHLQMRIRTNAVFPHEIGIFLGYPLHDVVGFIENAGKNCCCCGCWKVYANAGKAKRLFAKYEKCRAVYCRQHLEGKPIMRLTVAA